MAETETLLVAETNGRNRNTFGSRNQCPKPKHLKKQKQFSVAGLQPGFQLQDCNQYFWGVAISQFWAQNTSDLLKGYSPSRFFTSQNKIIKITLGSKGPGTKGKLDFHRQKT